jgi:hypothetical protein
MAPLQPVPKVPSPVAGREGAVAVLLGIALLLAIVKPWGSPANLVGPTPFASPAPGAEASTSVGNDSGLEVDLFGPFEPTPEWSIWPAGYFVSVMYVARAPGYDVRPSPAPSAGSPAPPAASAATAPPAPGSEWPSRIDVPPQDHLLWLGIDTPRGWSLDSAVLRRVNGDGSDTVVPTRLIPSPWPSHFSVVALAGGTADSNLAVWPAGDYELELAVSPGDVRRTIEVRIRTIPDPEPGRSRDQR